VVVVERVLSLGDGGETVAAVRLIRERVAEVKQLLAECMRELDRCPSLRLNLHHPTYTKQLSSLVESESHAYVVLTLRKVLNLILELAAAEPEPDVCGIRVNLDLVDRDARELRLRKGDCFARKNDRRPADESQVVREARQGVVGHRERLGVDVHCDVLADNLNRDRFGHLGLVVAIVCDTAETVQIVGETISPRGEAVCKLTR